MKVSHKKKKIRNEVPDEDWQKQGPSLKFKKVRCEEARPSQSSLAPFWFVPSNTNNQDHNDPSKPSYRFTIKLASLEATLVPDRLAHRDEM